MTRGRALLTRIVNQALAKGGEPIVEIKPIMDRNRFDITLTFTCYDSALLRTRYVVALANSGYDSDEQAELLAAFDTGDSEAEAAALRECIADALPNGGWLDFGVEY